MLGAVIAVAFLLIDLPVLALNAVVIPISAIPAVGFLVWVGKERRSPMVKAQNIVAGFWVVAVSTLVAHLATAIPGDTTTALVSTTGIEIVIWLLLYHITRRLYSKGRQRNIASASGKPLDDPEVRTLANNQDLATALLAAMLFTTKSIVLMQSNFVPYLTPEATRVMGITLGSSLGLILFNFCPNQTSIREFIARSARSE